MVEAKVQVLLFWIAVGFCFIGTLFFLCGFIFKKNSFIKYGTLSSYFAALPMLVALILRWVETGHIPSIGAYEVFTIYAGGVLIFYLGVQVWKPNLRITGSIVLPIVMLLTGIGIMSSTELTELPKSYFTYWLGIHMLFATLSLGGILVAAGLSITYLLKKRQEEKGKVNSLLVRLPSLADMDFWGYRFSLFSFLMIGIMIGSGAIWGYKSWGRYWGWDPIETWSLISWLTYGLYLHLRITWVKGKLAAWLHIVVIALTVFSFFGAPYLYPTIHDRFVNTTNPY